MPTQMTEKLFAHINNDAFLLGSVGLQGSNFSTTINYLNEFIQEKAAHGEVVSEELRELAKTSSDLASYQNDLSNLTDPERFTKLAERITLKTLSLEQGESTLMPGGWQEHTSGHAMAYQITKDEEGNYLFRVHNSGAGLEYHAKREEKDNLLYNPVLTYKIPKENMKKSTFALIIKKILEAMDPTKLKSKRRNEKYVYEGLLPLLEGHLGARIVEEHDPKFKKFTRGQVSGTCAQHSLHQVMKSSFKELDDYRKFIYEFKAKSLDDYWKTLTEEDLKNPNKKSVIEKAIQHQLRLLNLFKTKEPRSTPEEPLFALEIKERELSKLKGYLEALRPEALARMKEPKSSPAPPNKVSLKLTVPEITSTTITEQIPNKCGEFFFITTSPGGPDLLTDMETLIRNCQDGPWKYNNQIIFEQLEAFITSLPVCTPLKGPLLHYYSALNTEEKALRFIQQLVTIQAIYFKTCSSLSKELMSQKWLMLSRFYVAKMSLFAVGAHIHANHPLVHDGPNYLDFVSPLVKNIKVNSPYLATDSPKLDKRLMEVCEACDSLPSSGSVLEKSDRHLLKAHFLQLINESPSLKKKLEDKYHETYDGCKDEKDASTGLLTERARTLNIVHRNKCEAMYYFCNYRASLERLPEFKPLIEKFKLLESYQSLYGGFINDILQEEKKSPKDGFLGEISLNVSSQRAGDEVDFMTGMDSIKSPLFLTSELASSMYNIYKFSTREALKEDSLFFRDFNRQKSDNETQLSIAFKDLELYSLRHCKSTQVLNTLDYFSRQLEKLDTQLGLGAYVEANIMEPPLLKIQLLENETEFFRAFYRFLEKGGNYYQKNDQLKLEALSFVRLGALVHQYALKLDRKRFQPYFVSYMATLNQQISLQKNPAILSTLHYYRYEGLLNQEKSSDEELFQLILSNAYIKMFPQYTVLSPNSRFQNQFLKSSYLIRLATHRDRITTDMLLRIMTELNVPIPLMKDPKITTDGPLVKIKDGLETYTFNIETGELFKDNLAYQATPLEILNHPLTRALGCHDVKNCFARIDNEGTSAMIGEGIFLLDKPPISLRFFRPRSWDRSFRIQKKWPNPFPPYEEKWYELAPITDAALNHWKVRNAYRMGLPEIFSGLESTIWLSTTDKTFLIVDGHWQVRYQGDETTQKLTSMLDGKPHGEVVGNSTNSLSDPLKHFEGEQYIITQEVAPEQYLIDLPRVGVQLKVKRTLEGSFEYTYEEEDSTYVLEKTSEALGRGVAQLTFKNEEETFCLLAVQPFFSTGRRSEHSEYFKLEQDINSKIHPKAGLLWQYTGSENVMKIKLEEGEPVPASREQALYLTYVYLCTDQPEKAHAMLQTCFTTWGGLEGTFLELKYLHWIIDYLPFPLTGKDERTMISRADDPTLVTPKVVACKLKALSLLTQYSRTTGKGISFPSPSFSLDTANGRYERDCIEATKKFYETHTLRIYSLFKELHKFRSELPHAFELRESEVKSLLNAVQDNSSTQLTGALKYELVQLHLNQLKQECIDLEAKIQTEEAAGRKPSVYDLRRRQAITTLISKQEDITRTSSTLTSEPIRFPMNIKRDKYSSYLDTQYCSKEVQVLLTDPAKNPFNKPNDISTHHELVESLSLETTDDEMITNFPELLCIALTLDNPERSRLITFCKAVLLASRTMALDIKYENMPILCNVLLRIATHTEHPVRHVRTPPLTLSHLKFLNLDRGMRGISGESKEKQPCTMFEAFGIIISHADGLPDPDTIHIPVFKDDTTQLLARGSSLWRNIESKMPVIPPIVPDRQRIEEWLPASFLHLREAWQVQEALFQNPTGSMDTTTDSHGLDPKEYQAGCIKYDALKALQAFANSTLATPATIEEISASSLKKSRDLSTRLAQLEATLLELANRGPDDPALKAKWHIDVQAGKKGSLDMKALLGLYFQSDKTLYAKMTGLSDEKINELHDLLVTYVAESLQLQQCVRVNKALEALEKSSTTEEQQRLRFTLAQTMFSINRVDVVKDPALSIFQLFEDKLLRAQQQAALTRLLTKEGEGFKQTIEKIIMGGGKSKVILPTMAYKKADGTNLVLIEVPNALLHTNYVDLKNTSLNLFGQDAYLFEFNRDSNCSAKRLKQLYEELTDVMVSKRYVVTTGDALQSLELKYIELLHQRPINDHELQGWREQVIWAERLVSLVKHRGDAVIDEVHQGLWLKNKLNYTLGDAKPLPQAMQKHAVRMYQFFRHVNIAACFSPPRTTPYSLENAIIDRYEFNDINMSDVMQTLVQALLTHPESPIKALSTHDHKILREYLFGKSATVPDFILNADKETKHKIAFYKEQISHMLPFTLKRHQGEHFGPSKANTTPMERLRAIPYSANNVPNERSHFGNHFETLDFTIQSLLISGIDAKEMREMAIHWLKTADREQLDLRVNHIEETDIAKKLQAYAKGRFPFKLSELDPNNAQHIQTLVDVLGHEPDVIYEMLQDLVLPTITVHDTVLHSDAYSHVGLVRSCQGMSGTPWNHSTFHSALHYSSESGLGTDGYVIKGIEEKKPTIRAIDYEKPESYIASLFSPTGTQTNARAIIDISATFKGVENREVAEILAHLFFTHKSQFSNPPIKYVLFYNNGVLSALKVQSNVKNQVPITIGSSDPENIRKKLGGCPPEARFTFYDQAHTIGSDIKQGANAKALVLIDPTTYSQHFLQGAMRMRDLIEGDQTLDIIVPKEMAKDSLKDIIQRMVSNEKELLQQVNFTSALAQMKNLIREDFKQRLFEIDEEEVDKKHDFMRWVEDYFLEKEEEDFFKRYGGVDETRSTADILHDLEESLLNEWEGLLARMGTKDIPRDNMAEALGEIIDKALKPNVCSLTQTVRKGELAAEVEVKKEQHKELKKEIEQQNQHETKDKPKLAEEIEEVFHPWTVLRNGEFKLSEPPTGLGEEEPFFLPLKAMCTLEPEVIPPPNFSDDLLVSQNFRKTYKGQKNPMTTLKPVHALLFTYEGARLKCTLLTQQECFHITNSRQAGSNWWISTTQHTTLAGRQPRKIDENKTYQSFIEQARYFNGECNLLLDNTDSFSWLLENNKEKIDFFREYIQPAREPLLSDAISFCRYCEVNIQTLRHMAENPWIDRSLDDWELTCKTVSVEDRRGFESLAKALHDITTQWKAPLTAAQYIEKYHLPATTVPLVKAYLEQLGALKTLLFCFETMDFSSITEKVRAPLIKLRPELAPLIPRGCVRIETAMPCLTFLLKTFPMCQELPSLLERIPKAFYPEVMAAVAGNKDILKTYLSNRSLSLDELITLITPHPLNSEHIDLILSHTEWHTEAIFQILLKKTDTFASLNALKQHSNYQNMSRDELKNLIACAKEDAFLHACLQHRHADESIYLECLHHSAASTKSLLFILQHTDNPGLFERIADHKAFKKASPAREEMFYLLATTANTPIRILVQIAECTRRADTILALVHRLELEAPSPERNKIFKSLLTNSYTPIEALVRIGHKMDCADKLIRILSRKSEKLVFYLRRLAQTPLEQQSKEDWRLLEESANQSDDINIKNALRIAEIQYFINHLIEKNGQRESRDFRIDALRGPFQSLINHLESGKREGIPEICRMVQVKIELASDGPLVSEFKYLKCVLQTLGILTTDATKSSENPLLFFSESGSLEVLEQIDEHQNPLTPKT